MQVSAPKSSRSLEIGFGMALAIGASCTSLVAALIAGYGLVLGLWCHERLRVMLLLSHAVA